MLTNFNYQLLVSYYYFSINFLKEMQTKQSETSMNLPVHSHIDKLFEIINEFYFENIYFFYGKIYSAGHTHKQNVKPRTLSGTA